MAKPETLTASAGAMLLMLAALIGGLADGLRRITMENSLPAPKHNIYAYVTPDNLKVFEAGVDNSYRYYTFYGNLALVVFALVPIRIAALAAGWLPSVGALEVFLLLGSGLLE